MFENGCKSLVDSFVDRSTNLRKASTVDLVAGVSVGGLLVTVGISVGITVGDLLVTVGITVGDIIVTVVGAMLADGVADIDEVVVVGIIVGDIVVTVVGEVLADGVAAIDEVVAVGVLSRFFSPFCLFSSLSIICSNFFITIFIFFTTSDPV